uniref:Uncharacterized protein n=1 Tax=Caenorhabditis japonica TaxID=281687 RepID=A0A8R1IVG8_CAEJA
MVPINLLPVTKLLVSTHTHTNLQSVLPSFFPSAAPYCQTILAADKRTTPCKKSCETISESRGHSIHRLSKRGTNQPPVFCVFARAYPRNA